MIVHLTYTQIFLFKNGKCETGSHIFQTTNMNVERRQCTVHIFCYRHFYLQNNRVGIWSLNIKIAQMIFVLENRKKIRSPRIVVNRIVCRMILPKCGIVWFSRQTIWRVDIINNFWHWPTDNLKSHHLYYCLLWNRWHEHTYCESYFIHECHKLEFQSTLNVECNAHALEK